MFTLTKMKMEHVDAAVSITADAKKLLRERGVSQWQRGTYPDRQVFLSDVDQGIGYVLLEEDELVAVCAVTYTDEACYRRKNLINGDWTLSDDLCYATIHRSAVAKAHQGRHISTVLFETVKEMAMKAGAHSIRIDTHPDNLVMQGALFRAGFVKKNSFYLLDGDEIGDLRYGYELVF